MTVCHSEGGGEEGVVAVMTEFFYHGHMFTFQLFNVAK